MGIWLSVLAPTYLDVRQYYFVLMFFYLFVCFNLLLFFFDVLRIQDGGVMASVSLTCS